MVPSLMFPLCLPQIVFTLCSPSASRFNKRNGLQLAVLVVLRVKSNVLTLKLKLVTHSFHIKRLLHRYILSTAEYDPAVKDCRNWDSVDKVTDFTTLNM